MKKLSKAAKSIKSAFTKKRERSSTTPLPSAPPPAAPSAAPSAPPQRSPARPPARSPKRSPHTPSIESCERSAFEKLPDDLLHKIAEKVPLAQDQARLAQVCRSTRRVVSAKLDKEKPITLTVDLIVDEFKYMIAGIQFLPDGETLLVKIHSYNRGDRLGIGGGYYTFLHLHIPSNKTTKSLNIGKYPSLSENKLVAATVNGREYTVYNMQTLEAMRTGSFTHQVKEIAVANDGTVVGSIYVPTAEISQEERRYLPYSHYERRTTKRYVVLRPDDSVVFLQKPQHKEGRIEFSTLRFTPNGRYLVGRVSFLVLPPPNTSMVYLDERQIWVWDAYSGQHISTIPSLVRPPPRGLNKLDITFSPNNRSIFLYGTVWDITNGRSEVVFYKSRTIAITENISVTEERAFFSPDGKEVLVHTDGAVVIICDLARRKARAITGDDVYGDPYSHDGKFKLISDTRKNEIHIMKGRTIVRNMVSKHPFHGVAVSAKYGVSWEVPKKASNPILRAWPIAPSTRTSP